MEPLIKSPKGSEIPSREGSHTPPSEKEMFLQKCLGMGYISSQEGIIKNEGYLYESYVVVDPG